jgi:hypothetical protein
LAAGIVNSIGEFEIRCPAPWNVGRKAGPIRNSIIGALFEFDEILSYPLPGSKGTHDMVRKARPRIKKPLDTDPG